MEPIRALRSRTVVLPAANIDTDQIIPAQYLTLVPTIAEEYEKLGSYAMDGLPDDLYPIEFIKRVPPRQITRSSWPARTSAVAVHVSTLRSPLVRQGWM